MSWLDHPLHCECQECVSKDPQPSYAGRRSTARSLIEQLTRRGASFGLVDGEVWVTPSRLLADEERSELRRVKDEVQNLIREDDEKRERGEAYIRDKGVTFELFREFRSKTHKGAA